ncbi:AMP-binding protein [Microbacterium sp. ET2]|uniref:AMP-binding protein n=1 Tax=Microbacterium albipurpureum TaxID=3050384 RepID=UPI00259CDF0B|nr:AMP-binding protein [Microbacterium sp. ET2 (Ac-2212)]WJL96777.1 AMP-binding protein [Microbacterium sp. ET2 (Ac-2212)]
MSGLDTPLTPLRFLERALEVHPDRLAVVDGDLRLTYADFGSYVRRFADALEQAGIRAGDRVLYLGSNAAPMLAAHYAVPALGAVLVAVNTRLSPAEITYIVEHSGATLVIGDSDLLETLGDDIRASLPRTIARGTSVPRSTEDFDAFLASGTDRPRSWEVADEASAITINYTSGTTGRPKGVVYTHRGAYLNALGELVHQGFTAEQDGARYLWTLPMFHCNGWCTTWALTAAAGTHVCLPAVRGPEIWRLIDQERVTHMAGAPTVLSILASADEAHPLDRPFTITTAGAPPSPTIIARMHGLGIRVVHVYGLTETYGPYSVCELKSSWNEEDADQVAALISRQGVGMLTSDRMRVVRRDRDGALVDVASDSTEMGEIVMRGNSVMAGYYRADEATAEAFRGGWFHSGDLGVIHPDGYVQLLDRSKDIIISGGENISTIEVEQALLSHPAVTDAAVVGIPDERWGERPRAFIVTSEGASITGDELHLHVRGRLAPFKAPRAFEFVEALPKTSTGKTRKDVLRTM